jgi:hypothetical protein
MARGRKIKRVKSLYKPRKSQSRKVFEVAAMVVVVCVLGFVGWNIGSALLNYSPPNNEQPVGRDAHGTPNNNQPIEYDEPDASDEDVPPESSKNFNAILAPSSVLDNQTSLAAYIRQAENNGFNAVVLEIKDSTGHLFYASEFEPIQGSEIIRGTLTAEQIIAAFDGTGVKPIARLNTLLDRLGPRVLSDVSYVFEAGGGRWADDFLDLGGKLWANPFLQGTRDYHLFITDELTNAGFTDIILANITFPRFRNSDRELLEARFTVPATRFEGLVGFVKALEISGANLYLEMTVADLLEDTATAEVLRGGKDLNSFELLLIYNKDDFSAEHETSSNTSAIVSAMYGRAANQFGDFGITPLLNREGLSDREIADILGAFGELGFESFVIR